MGDADVIVVGAGIAGLAAAHALQQAGLQVIVLEASDEVGGRMRSVEHDGCVVDLGAQFVSAGYDTLHALAEATGVEIAPLATPYSAILRDGRPLRLRPHMPGDAVTRGLLTAWQAVRYGWRLFRDSGRRQPGDLADYACWAGQDDESAADWLARHDLLQVGRMAVEPLLEGLYFQQPETTSKAMLLMVAAFARRGHPNQCVIGGMGALPRALSRGLDVRLGHRVQRLHPGPAGVDVALHDGTSLHARRVVCAVPASAALALWPDAPPLQQALMETPYSAGLLVSYWLDPAWAPPAPMRDLYGVLVPRGECATLAALAFERAKQATPHAGPQVVQAMLREEAARRWMPASDTAIVDAVRGPLERLLGPLGNALRHVRVTRWPEAMPRSPVGRARQVAHYRATMSDDDRILLAGDYLGAPWTDSAAQSGHWVARRIIAAGQRAPAVSNGLPHAN